jgi:lysophospholipase L1-like esterase
VPVPSRLPLVARLVLTGLVLAGLVAAAAPAAAQPPPRRDVTVFVAGDSTAATYAAADRPRAGWGQALEAFLARDVIVVNEAWSGASSRSFADAGRLDRILSAVQPGDYLLISFGHNDQKTDARGTDPFTTYQDQLQRYIDGVRDRGAHPVLVTPVERRRFDAAGNVRTSLGDYPEAMRQLAAEQRVPVVDLAALSLQRWAALGPSGSQDEFLWLSPGEHANYPNGVQDNTHFQARGAIELARLVVGELKAQRVLHPRSTRALGDDVDDSSLTWPAVRPAEA